MVGRHDAVTMFPGVEDDVDVDDVRVARPATQLADGEGDVFVHHDDLNTICVNEPGQPGLPGTTSPCLSQDAGHDVHLGARAQGLVQHVEHANVSPFAGDQCAGVD